MFDRMKSGWQLTKKSWAVVRSHPTIARLPVYGGSLALLVAVVVVAPGVGLLGVDDNTGATIGGIVLIAIGSYLASFCVIYFNVALAAAANQVLIGDEPDIRAARRAARSRIGTIAAWAVISVAVSLLLSVIRDRAGFLGGLVAAIGGTIWSLVTFLVIPVVAFEGIGPIAAMKRSATLFRERWGQQVAGNIAIGGISGLIVLLGVVLGVVGVVLLTSGSSAGEIAGAVLLLIGFVLAIAGAVFGGAVRGVFGVALYHYVAEDRAVGPFTSVELASTARST